MRVCSKEVGWVSSLQTGSLDLSASDVASRHSRCLSGPPWAVQNVFPQLEPPGAPHTSDRGATTSPVVVAQGEAGSCHSEDGERAGLPGVAVEASVGGHGPAAAPLAGRSSGKPRWLAKSPDFSSGILLSIYSKQAYFDTRQEVSEPNNLLFPPNCTLRAGSIPALPMASAGLSGTSGSPREACA